MFIIVGLGNPGLKYEGTRHNIGFDVIDKIAEEYHIAVDTRKHRALIGRGDRRLQSDTRKASDLYESERREYPGVGGLL